MKKTICLLSLVLGLSFAHAQTIVSYNFNSDRSATVDAAFSGLVTADDYILNVGGRSGAGNVFVQGNQTPLTTATTTGANESLYHEFTLNIVGLDPNERLNLTAWTGRYFTDSNSAFRTAFYSDAGTLDFVDADSLNLIQGGFGDDFNFSVDLTGTTNTIAGSNFTGLTNGQSISFRFYFGDTSSSASQRQRLDNIALSGNISVIPEPSAAAALFGTAALGLVLGRRRR